MLNTFRKSMFGSFDYTDTMLEINFAMLIDFVDNGDLEIVNWDADEAHQNARETMQELYEWWTISRPILKERIDDIYELASSKTTSRFIPFDEDPKLVEWEVDYKENSKSLYDLAMGFEDVLYHIENDMLQKLISIRRWLWT